jgi:hypothetical protein
VEFAYISVKMGGFPLLKPVFDGDEHDAELVRQLRHLVAVQEELVAYNAKGYKRNLLHILAAQPSLTRV